MLRMLIVDDEPDITDALHTLIEESFPDQLDLYKAYSGKAALEWLNRGKFDLVLSDIRMPVISGLDLHREIRRLWPRCKVVFLTGHSEFDYVYEAIQYENTSYLLKTEDHDTILDTIRHVIEVIQTESEIEGFVERSLHQMEQVLPLLQTDLLHDFLFDTLDPAQDYERAFAESKLVFEFQKPVLVVHGRMTAMQSMSRTQLYTAVQLYEEKYGYTHIRIKGIIVNQTTIAWFIQPAETSVEEHLNWKEAVVAAKAFFESFEAMLMETLAIELRCVMDTTPCSWDYVSERWSALTLENNKQATDDGGFFQISFSDGQYVEVKYAKKLELMKSLLAEGKQEEFVAVFAKLTEHRNHFSMIHYPLVLLIVEYVHRFQLQDKITTEQYAISEWIKPTHSEQAIVELLQQFEQVFEQIFAWQLQERENKRNIEITLLKQYIEQHLADDLSLVRLSEVVGWHPSYLSRAFKKETGINLLHYIHDMKLQVAKQLLLQSDKKIHEISSELGFISPPHFTRFFKKGYGCTPQEFRTEH